MKRTLLALMAIAMIGCQPVYTYESTGVLIGVTCIKENVWRQGSIGCLASVKTEDGVKVYPSVDDPTQSIGKPVTVAKNNSGECRIIPTIE